MRFLIIYSYIEDDFVPMHGSVPGCFHHNPPTIEEVRDMENEIEKEFSINGVVITNWLPLSEENNTSNA